MRSKILARMMLTAIIFAVLATAAGHAQNLNSSTARLCNGLPYLCEKGFDEVTFPGNHNSGSGAGNWWGDPHPDCLRYCDLGTCLSSCTFRNQGKTITRQLEFGIRYFDIDTCICQDELVTCHKVPIGPKISQMLKEFDVFLNLEENRNEVIVLTFGDQRSSDIDYLQGKLYDQLKSWTEGNKEVGKATIFKKDPADPWPTLGDLVETNQRIVVFLRQPSDSLRTSFEDIGVLSERDHIFDTWKDRWCIGSCDDRLYDTEHKCREAYLGLSDKLVLISFFCQGDRCLSTFGRLCQGHLLASLDICRDELWGGIPNFIIADWTQNYMYQPNIVNVVKYFNQKILKGEGNALNISNDAASHIGFESNRNGKMISAGSAGTEFNTQRLTDKELWKWEKLDGTGGDLDYGTEICLQSKLNGRYLSSIVSSQGGLGVFNMDGTTLMSFALDFEQGDGLTAGDVNGDGRAEIIHGDRANRIQIFAMDGTLLNSFPLNFEEGDGLTAGDVDGDGRAEIIHGDRANRIQIFAMDGTALMSFALDFEQGDGLTAGDVNGDGRAEIIHGDRANRIQIFAMDGTLLNSFPLNFEQGDGLTAGNVVGDQKAEIIHGDRGDEIQIFDMDGNKKPESFALNFEQGDGLTAGDVDGDGWAEIIHGDRANRIQIFDMDGTPPKSFPLDFEEGDGLTAGDVDEDGWAEIIHGDRGSNWIQMSLDCGDYEKWRILRYESHDTFGRVQAGDQICLYSVDKDKYVRAYDHSLGLESHCKSDEWWYVHAGWNDSDEDRVIDEGDNCPNTYNPEQKDSDDDGKGDACDFALPFLNLLLLN